MSRSFIDLLVVYRVEQILQERERWLVVLRAQSVEVHNHIVPVNDAVQHLDEVSNNLHEGILVLL